MGDLGIRLQPGAPTPTDPDKELMEETEEAPAATPPAPATPRPAASPVLVAKEEKEEEKKPKKPIAGPSSIYFEIPTARLFPFFRDASGVPLVEQGSGIDGAYYEGGFTVGVTQPFVRFDKGYTAYLLRWGVGGGLHLGVGTTPRVKDADGKEQDGSINVNGGVHADFFVKLQWGNLVPALRENNFGVMEPVVTGGVIAGGASEGTGGSAPFVFGAKIGPGFDILTWGGTKVEKVKGRTVLRQTTSCTLTGTVEVGASTDHVTYAQPVVGLRCTLSPKKR